VRKACRDNRSVLYERIPKCLAISGLPPTVAVIRLMRVLGGAKLLILGDGALGPRAAPRTLDVVEDGYVRASRRLGVTGTTSTTVELHLRLASSQAQ
jgi:hypothetical protein